MPRSPWLSACARQRVRFGVGIFFLVQVFLVFGLIYWLFCPSQPLALYTPRILALPSHADKPEVFWKIPPLNRTIPNPFAFLTPNPVADYEIFYTNFGYIPEHIKIPIGSRVAFHNMSDLPMWTASDPHPVHNDFSYFDSLRALTRNETYIFQFTSAGSFGFHNHSKSNHRGVVQVFDPIHPAANIDKTKAARRTQRDALLALFDHHNTDSIFTVIDTIEASGALVRDCHDMAHDLGHRAYELFGFSTAMTFNLPSRAAHTSVDDICAGGYMHGILEELFLNRPELQYTPAAVCAGIPERHQGSCFHGVGHGLMFTHKRQVAASITSCRTLTDSTDMYRCFEGVWMEFFWGNTDHAGANSLGWDTSAPLAVCQNAKQDEKPTCYLYAHLGYLRTHPRDYTGVVNFCTTPTLAESDVQFCIKGIGITMMKHFTSHHLERTETLVSGLSDARKRAYYSGVIGYALLSDVPRASVAQFCGELTTDSALCIAELNQAED